MNQDLSLVSHNIKNLLLKETILITGVANGGNGLRNIIPNFFSEQELQAVWHEFNTNPRWQYRRMSGGKWFWWYMFLGQNQFVGNNTEQWNNCTAPIWK